MCLRRSDRAERRPLQDWPGKGTMLCLASAHALVRLDYDTFVGDTIEKTALEALSWALISGGKVALTHP